MRVRRALVALVAGALALGCRAADDEVVVQTPETTSTTTTTTTTTVPPDPLAWCQTTVDELLPQVPPAPGWTVVCQPPEPPGAEMHGHEGWTDWADHTIHLALSGNEPASWVYLHEVGHTWCGLDDLSEFCAWDWVYKNARHFMDPRPGL